MCSHQYNYKKEFLKHIKHTNTTDKTVIFSNFAIVFAAPITLGNF